MAVVQHQIQPVILVPVVVAEVLQKSLLGVGIVQVFSYLCYIAIGIPKQVVKLVCKAVVNTPCGVRFVVSGVGIDIARSCKVLQFAAQPPCGGVCWVCIMS